MGVPAVGVAGSGELPPRRCAALLLCCAASVRSARSSGMTCSKVGRSAGSCAQQRLQPGEQDGTAQDLHLACRSNAAKGSAVHASAQRQARSSHATQPAGHASLGKPGLPCVPKP